MFGLAQRKAARQAEQVASVRATLTAMIGALEGRPGPTTPLMLTTGERSVYRIDNSGLFETRRGPGQWTGRSAGTSVPVGLGVRTSRSISRTLRPGPRTAHHHRPRHRHVHQPARRLPRKQVDPRMDLHEAPRHPALLQPTLDRHPGIQPPEDLSVHLWRTETRHRAPLAGGRPRRLPRPARRPSLRIDDPTPSHRASPSPAHGSSRVDAAGNVAGSPITSIIRLVADQRCVIRTRRSLSGGVHLESDVR